MPVFKHTVSRQEGIAVGNARPHVLQKLAIARVAEVHGCPNAFGVAACLIDWLAVRANVPPPLQPALSCKVAHGRRSYEDALRLSLEVLLLLPLLRRLVADRCRRAAVPQQHDEPAHQRH